MQVPVGGPQMIQGESRTRAPCSKPQMQYYKKILETSLKQKKQCNCVSTALCPNSPAEGQSQGTGSH